MPISDAEIICLDYFWLQVGGNWIEDRYGANWSGKTAEAFASCPNLKVMLLPAVLFIGLKVFAIGFLFLEDVIAAYKVRAQARKLLKEAEEAEALRQSQLAALPEAEEEPPPPAKEKAPSAISRSSMMKSYFK